MQHCQVIWIAINKNDKWEFKIIITTFLSAPTITLSATQPPVVCAVKDSEVWNHHLSFNLRSQVNNCVEIRYLSGEQCDIAIYSPISDKSQIGEAVTSSNHGGLIAGLIVAILLIVVVVGALVYYRRRITHLKSELAHVQYIEDPSSVPGQSSSASINHYYSNNLGHYPVFATEGSKLAFGPS